MAQAKQTESQQLVEFINLEESHLNNAEGSKEGVLLTSKNKAPINVCVQSQSTVGNDPVSERDHESVSLHATAPDADSLKKEDEAGKSVTFAEDTEVYPISDQHNTPVIVSLDSPVQSGLSPTSDMSKVNENISNSAAVIPVSDISNSNKGNNGAESPHEEETSSHVTIKEQPSQNVETTQQVEHTGHRHFDVSNVDESELRRQNEAESETAKLDLENKPLLEKIPSVFAESYYGQNTHRANQDTIGPLENPTFLRMLNYSVSQPAEEDTYVGNSCLDLENLTSAAPPQSETDRGWAWVVLFAAFFSLSLTGATMFTAGVLMPAILDNIENDLTKASWVGAVHISVTCMAGPFVGIILNRLGARITAFIAGVILSTGLVLAAFVTSIVGLIFTHGLIAGLGAGIILNTMFVIVGQYFNRYRGLACGVLATGTGAGMLAGGSVLTAMFNHFGLSGTYLLWGGVCLHSLILALLLRPSPEEKLREAEKKMGQGGPLEKEPDYVGDINDMTSMMSGLNSLFGGDQQSVFSGRTSSVRRFHRNPGKQSRQDLNTAPLLKAVLHKDISRSSYSVATNRSVLSAHRKSNLNIPSSPSVGQSKLGFGLPPFSDNAHASSPGTTPLTHSPLAANPLSASEQTDQNDSAEKSNSLYPLGSSTGLSNIPEQDSSLIQPSSPTNSRAPSFRKRLLSGTSQAPSDYTSIGRLNYRPSIREQLQRHDLDNESLASTLVSHLQPQDALNPRYRLGSRSISSMMGSIASFPTALAIVKDDLARMEQTEEHKTLQDYFISFLDSLRLLRNRPFLVFISTCMLWALADSPYSLYLPTYAKSQGSTSMQASSLYTAMGCGSMCGRFLSGLVASDVDIGPVLLHIGCLGVASMIVSVSPWVTSTYLQQMLCSGLFGLYTGSLVPLSSLITIELLGIGELGLGFGFLSLAQGIGYLVGPPLLGVVIEALGYKVSFLIIGFIFVCASLLAMVIAILLRNSADEDLHDSFEDLEKALRRISDTDSKEDGSGDEGVPTEEDPSNRPSPLGQPKGTEDQVLAVTANVATGEDTKLLLVAEDNSAHAAELETITEEA